MINNQGTEFLTYSPNYIIIHVRKQQKTQNRPLSYYDKISGEIYILRKGAKAVMGIETGYRIIK